MKKINFKLLLLLIFKILILVKTEQISRNKRDYYGYYPSDEEKKLEYQLFQHHPGFYSIKNEYEPNPMSSILDKGFNFILLKVGFFGILKAISFLIFLSILAKLPFLMLKMAFIKSFFLPFIIAPLFIHLLSNQMSQPNESSMEEKPEENVAENESMMGLSDMDMMDMGRKISNNLNSIAWRSMKMFSESDQCMEKISCVFGAYNKDSRVGSLVLRMLKIFQTSSSKSLQRKFSSVKEAFNKGFESSNCSTEEYKCENPELFIQQGSNKVKIF